MSQYCYTPMKELCLAHKKSVGSDHEVIPYKVINRTFITLFCIIRVTVRQLFVCEV